MAGFDGYEAEFVEDAASLRQELEIERYQSEYYREAYADTAKALMAAENVGWQKLGFSDVDQIDLAKAKDIAKRLAGYRESNPLLTRGCEMRNSYLFSSEYEIGTRDAKSDITSQQQNIIDRKQNQDAVFSLAALERLETERYSSGQVFVLFDRSTKNFQHISFQEIDDIIYNPDDASVIWYVKRSWTARVISSDGSVQVVNKKEFYPASTYDGPFVTTINGVSVNTNKRMIVDRVNVKPGGNLGIPDSFAAAPWALAYSSYLSDGTKVLASLAEWAWVVKPKKQDASQRAAANVRTQRGAGGTLFTDMDVQSMPKGNAVDLNTGRPLAAQVASALGISVVLLLADPGQSGAYGTAQTLSDPNRRTMEARRQRNTDFLEHCLSLINVKNPAVVWAKMSPGTDKEEMELTMMAWGSGLFHEDEVRPRLADIAHIQIEHDNPPAGFKLPNNAKVDEAALKSQAANTVQPDGGTPVTNAQGRDNQGIGNASKTKAADGKTTTKPSANN